MHPQINWVSIGVILFATVPALIFPVRYAQKSNWRRNYVGWGLMNQAITIALVMLYVLFLNIWPDFPFKTELRVMTFMLIGIAFWWQVIVLFKAQREQPPDTTNFGRRSTDIGRKANGKSSAAARRGDRPGQAPGSSYQSRPEEPSLPRRGDGQPD